MQITIKDYENTLRLSLSIRAGLPYHKCTKCRTKYSRSGFKCPCNGIIIPINKSRIVLYRDCGCKGCWTSDYEFCIRHTKNFNVSIAKNYDLSPLIHQYGINKILCLKFGALTQLNAVVRNSTTINGVIIHDHNNFLPYVETNSYTLNIPVNNSIMYVNDIPCKLYYTEYTKSSYLGYFVSHIIALDYTPIKKHYERCKLLRALSRDKKSILSHLPREIINIIKNYMIQDFKLSCQGY